jgi:hypothetical protein
LITRAVRNTSSGRREHLVGSQQDLGAGRQVPGRDAEHTAVTGGEPGERGFEDLVPVVVHVLHPFEVADRRQDVARGLVWLPT